MRYLQPVLDWYAASARDLPWRRPGVGPWPVLVSEIMLQQTPVSRVIPAYHAWLERWPAPPDLAAEPAGEAVRQWGTLGYPRRALRLHETATILTSKYGGQVPADHDALLTLPGIGGYTAAAVAAFAFGHRHAVLDTNVRRVLARLVSAREFPPDHLSAAERSLAESLLPADASTAARWSVAVMELGALTCTAWRPACGQCPVTAQCAWLAAGRPPGTRPRGQKFTGTDRQCRGRLMAVLRSADAPVPQAQLDAVWPDATQRARALDGLVSDGLIDPLPDGRFSLPGLRRPRAAANGPPAPPRPAPSGPPAPLRPTPDDPSAPPRLTPMARQRHLVTLTGHWRTWGYGPRARGLRGG